LETGNATALSAYRELLLLVPANQRSALLKTITGFGMHNAVSSNRSGAIKAYGQLLDLLPEQERAGLLSDVINGGLANALTDRNLGAIEAFGVVLKSVPESHRAAAYLPKENFRKNELFQAFHSSGPQSKSTFVQTLRQVDEALVEHFKQSKQQAEASHSTPDQRRGAEILRDERTTVPASRSGQTPTSPDSFAIQNRIRIENIKTSLSR
jgi:hypothetical protein